MNQILLNGITIEQLAEALIPLLNIAKKTNENTQNDLLTRDEVCKLLSINKTSLWKHTKSGRLKSFGIGNRVYYKRNEVLEAVKPLNV
ncbi:Helix-turn-helix domain-containing protein [Flavobacterium resistens]|uniref:Helix-turn-helix domain-containing protein n=1 Tax=Flavobacterium resistens TaxID=443612 RepID=A0A521CTD7_9FLAO|nr:helix-turn-helix domain-containing protein [Flavobacterium resistens]MRX66965.1 helix-turn-helix domain-containing protein [Flavobacterium resistens]SMO62692.1 Helix-turn-helix domain-containing protein [Flavobacterium resistens]